MSLFCCMFLNQNFLVFSFKINSTTADLYTVAPLDRETTDHHILTVVAEDKGHPSPRRSLVCVLINVTDVNDNQPRFSARQYESRVLENQSAEKILSLTVSSHLFRRVS